MKYKNSIKIVSMLVAVLLCVEIISGGISIFAGQSSESKPVVSVTEEGADEHSSGGDKPNAAADENHGAPLKDGSQEGNQPKENPDEPVGGEPAQEPQTTPEKNSEAKPEPAPEQAPENPAPPIGPAPEPEAPPALPASPAPAEQTPQENAVEKYKVLIDDPFAKMGESAKETLGLGASGDAAMFEVSYKDGENTVKVNSGDEVAEGAELSVTAKTLVSQIKFYVNDAEHLTPEAKGETLTVTHVVSGDVKIYASLISPMHQNLGVAGSGGGIGTFAVSNTAELNNALNGHAVYTRKIMKQNEQGGTEYTTVETREYKMKFDSFDISLNGDVELDLPKLNGRSIKFSGDKTVTVFDSMKQTGGEVPLKPHTKEYDICKDGTTTPIGPWNKTENNKYTREEKADWTYSGGSWHQPVVDDSKYTFVADPSATSTPQTLTFDNSVKINTEKMVVVGLENKTCEYTLTGNGNIVLKHSDHVSLRAKGSGVNVSLSPSGTSPNLTDNYKGTLVLDGVSGTNGIMNLTGGTISLSNIGNKTFTNLSGITTLNGGNHTMSGTTVVGGTSLALTGGALLDAKAGGVNVNGAVSVASGCTLDATGKDIKAGSLTNNGTTNAVNVTTTSGGISNSGTFTAAGFIDAKTSISNTGGTMNVFGYAKAGTFIINNTVMEVAGDITAGSYINNSGTMKTTGGNVTAGTNIDNSGTIEAKGTGKNVTATNGYIKSSGTITTNDITAKNNIELSGSSTHTFKGLVRSVEGYVKAFGTTSVNAKSGTVAKKGIHISTPNYNNYGKNLELTENHLDNPETDGYDKYVLISGSGEVKGGQVSNVYGRMQVTDSAKISVGNLYAKGYAYIDSANADFANIYGGGVDSATGSPLVAGPNGHSYQGAGNNVLIRLKNGTVNGEIYGGGKNKDVSGIKYYITGGKITNASTNIYGGGLNANASSVELEVKGGTIAGSNIYGGGHGKTNGANVLGNVKVTVANPNDSVAKTVYGGGHAEAETATAGSTNVIVGASGAEYTNIYGGGHAVNSVATINGNTSLNLQSGGIVANNLYGGGISSTADKSAEVSGSATVNVSGTVKKDLFGGGTSTKNGDAPVGGYVDITVSGKVEKNLYGGGNENPVNGKDSSNNSTTILINGGTVGTTGQNYSLYGGGYNGLVNGNVKIETTGSANIYGNLYGGGNAAAVDSPVKGSTVITIDGGTVHQNLYAGGIGSGAEAKVENNTTTTINGTVKNSLYGGGTSPAAKNGKAPVGGYVNITVSGKVAQNLYGGGNENPVNNTTLNNPAVKIQINGTAKISDGTSDMYGGGYRGIVNGNVVIQTESASHLYGNLYGGGNGGTATSTNPADVKGTTHLTIKGKVDKTVYGGGINTSQIDKYTTIDINAGDESDIIGGDVYGGGADKDSPIFDRNMAVKNTANNEGASTEITINPGYIQGNVYGASKETVIKYNTEIKMLKGKVKGAIFGASRKISTDSDVLGVTRILMKDGDVYGNGEKGAIFGGGSNGSRVLNTANSNDLTRFATSVIVTGGNIHNNVYGGGEKQTNSSPVHGSSLVDISAGKVTSQKDVYGGGIKSETSGRTEVYIGSATAQNNCEVTGTVYGGGHGTGGDVTHPGGAYVNIRKYGTVREVFGGGNDNGHITNTKGTRVLIDGHVKYDEANQKGGLVYGGGNNKSDIQSGATEGTTVIISVTGLVDNDVFGGGHTSHVYSSKATNVWIYGRVNRNVYGGGYNGDVTEPRGPWVVVKGKGANEGTVDQGFVGYNVYGGGYGKTTGGHVKKTEIIINDGATVQHSVFGGGRGTDKTGGTLATVANTTKIDISGKTTVIGYRTEEAGLLNSNEKYTLCTECMFRGELDANDETTKQSPSLKGNTAWIQVGNVYGGGSFAKVGSDTSVNIHDMDQKAFNRVSGGNLGIRSANANRLVNINNLGLGNCTPRTLEEWNNLVANELNNTYYYTDFHEYVAIRFLQDYSVANANNSYTIVYYNLKTTDDGVADDEVYGLENSHNSVFNVTGGVYYPWRQKEHKTIRVEPALAIHDYAKVRMEANYSINFVDGVSTTNQSVRSETKVAENKVTLLIDPARTVEHKFVRKYPDGSTSKIFGPDNNIKMDNIFCYEEILQTKTVENLQHQHTPAIRGINIYIPPINVESENVKPTTPGGSSKPDNGGNYSGGKTGTSGGRATGGGVGGVRSVIVAGPNGYYTDEKTIANHTTTLKKADNAINAAAKNKVAVVSEKKAGQINSQTLVAMAQAAKKAGKTVQYQADTLTSDNKLEGRMYIDTAKFTDIGKSIHTGVYTSKDRTARTTKIFSKYYKNNFRVVSLAHKGSFGATVKIAAKVDLGELKKDNLSFYVYSATANQFVKIDNPKYFVDSAGFIHFYTSVGGDVIISEGTLVRK